MVLLRFEQVCFVLKFSLNQMVLARVKVLKDTNISKERLLPLKGDVHVKTNDIVDSDTIIASTEIPGNVQMINIANELNIDPDQIEKYMLIKINDSDE